MQRPPGVSGRRGSRLRLTPAPVDLELYSYDTPIDRALPQAVVVPPTPRWNFAAVQSSSKYKIPFVPAAPANLCGCTVPLHERCDLRPTKMKKNPARTIRKTGGRGPAGRAEYSSQKRARALRVFLRARPFGQKACTIGGNVGTIAGGPHCVIMAYFPAHVGLDSCASTRQEIVRSVCNDRVMTCRPLLSGSEGPLGSSTPATLNILSDSPHMETIGSAFPSLESAIQTVRILFSAGFVRA